MFPFSQFEFDDIVHCRLEEAWFGYGIYMQKEVKLKAITYKTSEIILPGRMPVAYVHDPSKPVRDL